MSSEAEREDGKDTVEQAGDSAESDVAAGGSEDNEQTDAADDTSSEAESTSEPANEDASQADDAPAPAAHPRREGAAWARGFVRVDDALTWFEARLLFVALMALVLALVFWISLRGMSAPVASDGSAGTVFRMFVGAGVLGGIARAVAVRALKFDEVKSGAMTTLAVIIGAALAPAWRSVGVDHCDAILNWLQEGSAMNMMGGLRGISTRLTIIVAMLGASLAAARSKHINIDVVLRFMRPSLRVPVHLMGALATAAVCFIASYGFVDYTSIEGFQQNRDLSFSEKVAGLRQQSSIHRFVFWKQISLDASAMPDVIFRGVRWDAPTRMNGRQWNAWIDQAGFSERFTREEIDTMKVAPSLENEPRVPFAMLPGESAKGVLIHDLNLVWPLGLFWVGLRVLLRALLVLSGHASVEPDADDPDEVDLEVASDAAATEAAR